MSEGSAAEHRLGALAAKVEPVPAEALAASQARTSCASVRASARSTTTSHRV